MPRNAATNRFAIRDYAASLNFSGSTDRIDCGTDFVGTTAATISAWISVRGGGGGSNGRIFDNGRCVFFYSLANLAVGFNSDGASSIFSASGSVQINSGWIHVVVTRTAAGVANFFINSVVSGAADQTSGTPGAATTNAFIGNRNAQDRNFNGRMNEVVVWNRVLTATEISDLYFKGSVATSGLLRQFNLTTGAGTVAIDSSSNLTNGTITGATFSADVPMKARKASVNANMVPNGDFEYAPPFTAVTTTDARWVDGTAAGSTTNDLFRWATVFTSSNVAVRFDSSVFYTGLYSIKCSTTGVGSSAVASTIRSPSTAAQVIAYGIPVTPNTDYRITYWMKTNYTSGDSNDGAHIRLTTFTAAGSAVTSSDATKIKTTTDWTQYSLTITTGSTATLLQVQCRVVGSTGTGTLVMDAWFDDITLLPVYPEGRVPANGNLVKNFDFEVAPTFVAAQTTRQRYLDGSSGGSLTNQTYKWAINGTNSTSTNISAQFDSSVFYSGAYSMKVSLTGTNASIAISNILTSSQADVEAGAIRILPNTSYTYRVRMKTNYVSGDSGDGAFLQLTERNTSGASVQSTLTTKVKTTTDWTEYTGSFTTAASSVWLSPLLFIIGNTGAATLVMDAWFDDLYLAPTTNPGRVAIT